jgi:hypothetical protein
MRDRNEGERSFPRGLIVLSVLTIVAVVLCIAAWQVRTTFKKSLDRAYPIPHAQQGEVEQGNQNARWVEGRQIAYAQAGTDIAVFQLMLGVVGFVGLAYTIYYAKRAWSAAERSVQKSDETLRAMQDAERRELRACIHNEKANLTGVLGEDGRLVEIRISIAWRNCGQTPARNVICSASMATFEDSPPLNFDFPDIKKLGPEASRMTIGPGLFQESGLLIPLESINAMLVSKKQTYVWAWAEYNDVFDGGDRHRTEIAFEVFISPKKGPNDPHLVSTANLPVFNGVDGDCFRKPYST